MRKLQDTIWEESREVLILLSEEADQVLVVVVVVVIEANDICLDLPQEDTSHMEEEDMNMRIDITEEEEKAERDTMKEITIKNSKETNPKILANCFLLIFHILNVLIKLVYEETSKTE